MLPMAAAASTSRRHEALVEAPPSGDCHAKRRAGAFLMFPYGRRPEDPRLAEAPPRRQCHRGAPRRRHVGGPRRGRVGVLIRCRLGGARLFSPRWRPCGRADTGLWLHNKLGATDELWAPPSIASLLTAAVIDNIRLCFHGLSSAVKPKLLLGTLHLPRRTVDEVSARRRGRQSPALAALARRRLRPPLAALVPLARGPRPCPALRARRFRGAGPGPPRPGSPPGGVSWRAGLSPHTCSSLLSPQWVWPRFSSFLTARYVTFRAK